MQKMKKEDIENEIIVILTTLQLLCESDQEMKIILVPYIPCNHLFSLGEENGKPVIWFNAQHIDNLKDGGDDNGENSCGDSSMSS